MIPLRFCPNFRYEFYHDALKGGSYVWEIEKIHKEHGEILCQNLKIQSLILRLGPIIHIDPYEIYILTADPAFLNQLYPNVANNVDKWWWSARMFRSTDMAFGTAPHALHQKRRAAFS